MAKRKNSRKEKKKPKKDNVLIVDMHKSSSILNHSTCNYVY